MEKHGLQWFTPEMGDDERALVLDVLRSNYLNEGDVVTQFENEVAKLCNVKFAVATTSGTAAISLALMGYGIGLGDEVIVPNFTFIATANAVRLTGADVCLVDINPDRLTIDPEQVRASINRNTRAVIAVDVNGRGAEYDQLLEICKKFNLRLITDSAEAFGSSWQKQLIGSIGDAGCFSFSAAKTISTGQGGMVTTNDEALHNRIRELKDQGRRFRGSGGDDLHPVLGFNFKYTNLQAAIGIGQLGRLKKRLQGFKNRDNFYSDRLKDLPDIEFPVNHNDLGEYRQWTDVLISSRPKVCKALDRFHLGNRAFWFPLHTQIPYQDQQGNFENSIRVSQQGLWLPSGFSITEEDIDFVCSVIRKAVLSKV
jgi:perosamine synthetase